MMEQYGLYYYNTVFSFPQYAFNICSGEIEIQIYAIARASSDDVIVPQSHHYHADFLYSRLTCD